MVVAQSPVPHTALRFQFGVAILSASESWIKVIELEDDPTCARLRTLLQTYDPVELLIDSSVDGGFSVPPLTVLCCCPKQCHDKKLGL